MSSKTRFALNHIAAPGLGIDAFFALAHSLGLEEVEIRNDLAGVPIFDGTPAATVARRRGPRADQLCARLRCACSRPGAGQ